MTATEAPAPAIANVTAAPTESDLGPEFDALIERLNRLSVSNHHDAFEDIDWEAPEMALNLEDPRLRLYAHDPMSITDWYLALDDTEKARFALHRQAAMMKVGIQFENLLQRGLLRLAWSEPNGSTVYRYSHHEVIEESQHSLMFQEFINRSGLPVKGMSFFWRMIAPRLVLSAAAVDRPLFFIFVLGGEEPVDAQQRKVIRTGGGHPLAEEIMRIHVAEEARHIAFAKKWLQAEIPRMSRVRRFGLSIHLALTMGIMTRLMLVPNVKMRRELGIPRGQVAEAFRSELGQQYLSQSGARMQKLAKSLNLLNPVSVRLWKAFGVWSDDPT